MSDDIPHWLRAQGLGTYVRLFDEQQIDFEVLPELGEADLEKLGIPLGPRKKLLRAIAELDSEAQPQGRRYALESAVSKTGEAERRQLTVMFCDLVGSTALSQQLDPEELRHINLVYQDACKTAIERYDGYVARYMGDGVLAYFGYPRAHEDDPERAIHAGLALIDSLSGLADCPRDLRTRVGIATGAVVVGDLIGEGASQESAVVGKTPNLAARLQALAVPDTVVVAPATRKLARGVFDYVDLGSHALKGISDPVNAWRVRGLSRTESRFEAHHAQTLTKLVGREHEIGLLLDRWNDARNGDGQVVLLCGEAGIGKSRILQALRERTAMDDALRLRYQCSPYHVDSALYPVVESLWRTADISSENSAAGALYKIESLVAQAGMSTTRIVPLFASLLSISTGERYAAPDRDPQRHKEQMLGALIEHIVRLAGSEPVQLYFEDVHWADPTSLELLALLIERIQDRGVLLLLTCRPEFVSPWTRYTHITSLTLNRFSRTLAMSMVERLTRGKMLPRDVRDQIVAKTDGVPLFVEELTKTVLESELLEERDDAYVLIGPLTALAIPSTLQDSLMARLDRLSAVKSVAQTAAAIGREFSYATLAAVVPLGDDALRAALARFIDAGLLFGVGRPPHTRYLFKHALVRDAAYESLLKSRRRDLHARIAQALESDPGAGTVAPELLAQHYFAAEMNEAAADHWLVAARRAMQRSENGESVAHLGKALVALRLLPRSVARDHKELDCQLLLSSSLTTTLGWGSEESMVAISRADELCEKLGETQKLLPVLVFQGVKLWIEADYRTAIEVGNRIVRIAGDLHKPREAMAGKIINGWPNLGFGELAPVLSAAEHVLGQYEPGRHKEYRFQYGLDLKVEALAMRGYVLWFYGFAEQAARSFADAIAWACELEHAGSVAWALNWAGAQPAAMRMDVDGAYARSSELLQLADKDRSPIDSAWARTTLGWAIAKSGQGRQGLELAQAGLVYLGRKKCRALRSVHLGLLAELQTDAADFAGASNTLADAERHIANADEHLWSAEIHRLQGEMMLARAPDGVEAAARRFATALDIARQRGTKPLELRAATSLARLRLQQGRAEEARRILEPTFLSFSEGHGDADLVDAKQLLDRC